MNTDLGIDRIFIYDKELREVSSVSAPKGSGPRHLCVLDDTHVACADELSCAITLYSYCQGSLCFQASLPLYRGAKNPLWKPAAVRKDGDKLYVSVRGMDRVLVFSWDGLNLAPVQSVACGGASPRDIIVDDGLLYCMNEGSSTVTMFALNPDNGMIGRKLNEELRIPGVLCAVIGS